MNNLEAISQQLKAGAINNGLCQKWTEEWKEGLSLEDLYERWVKGYDFITEHRFPSDEYIKANFDHQWLREKRIFIDDEFESGGFYGYAFLHGKSTGTIILTHAYVATIYVRDNSVLNVGVGDIASAHITAYDNAEINVMQSMRSTVTVYKKSPNCKINAKGNVKIIENF